MIFPVPLPYMHGDSLKRCLSFPQFCKGLLNEFGVSTAGFEVFVSGGPEFFGFSIPLQVPQGQPFVPIDAWLIGEID